MGLASGLMRVFKLPYLYALHEPGKLRRNVLGDPVALKVIEIIKRGNLPDRAITLGTIVRKRLFEMQDRYRIIGDVRGLDLMQAIELVKDQITKESPSRKHK